MPRIAYTEAQRERVCELREFGKTFSQISRLTGISVSHATWLCMREGVQHPEKPPRLYPPGDRPQFRRGRSTVRPFTAAEDAQILRLRAAGAGYTAIARALTSPRCHTSILGRLVTLARRAELLETEDA